VCDRGSLPAADPDELPRNLRIKKLFRFLPDLYSGKGALLSLWQSPFFCTEKNIFSEASRNLQAFPAFFFLQKTPFFYKNLLKNLFCGITYISVTVGG
jgi:hypothetical protein